MAYKSTYKGYGSLSRHFPCNGQFKEIEKPKKVSSHKRLVNQRERLHEKNNGKCFWCDQLTVLPPKEKKIKSFPLNVATIDHLDDRFDPERGKKKGMRHVLACWECNNRRSRLRQAHEISIDELRRRSGRKKYPENTKEYFLDSDKNRFETSIQKK